MATNTTQPASAFQLLFQVANTVARLESNLKKTNARLDELAGAVDSKINIPCPAKGCLKKFRNNGHRNRHIRSIVKKTSPSPDALWKEHEEAGRGLNIISEEDLPDGSDNDTDPQDDVQQGTPPLEIRASSAPLFADYSQGPPLDWQYQQPAFYQIPSLQGFEQMNHPGNDVFSFGLQNAEPLMQSGGAANDNVLPPLSEHEQIEFQEFLAAIDVMPLSSSEFEQLFERGLQEFLSQDIPGSGFDEKGADRAHQPALD